MRAMTLNALGPLLDNPAPLAMVELPDPVPADDELLIEVIFAAFATPSWTRSRAGRRRRGCRSSWATRSSGGSRRWARTRTFGVGDRVGVAWIFCACGTCEFCRRGEENLCDHFRATGHDVNGGYAELMTVAEAFAHRIPDVFTDAEAAPLLCTGRSATGRCG